MSDDDLELIQAFAQEARELIEEVEPRLIQLQQTAEVAGGQADPELVNVIFRLFHSMKGSAGFLNLNVVVEVAHVAETLLDTFRKGDREINATYTELFCESCDFFNSLLDQIESTGSDAGIDCQAIVAKFTTALEDPASFEAGGGAAGGSAPDAAPEVPVEPEASAEVQSNDSAESSDSPYENIEITITPEMREVFLAEGSDLIEGIEANLLGLVDNPRSQEHIQDLFRHMHSFKGNCGFMGFAQLERISHHAETLLGCVKEGAMPFNQNVEKTLLGVHDALKQAVQDIRDNGPGNVADMDMYLSSIKSLLPADALSELAEDTAASHPDITPEGSEGDHVLEPAPVVDVLEPAESLKQSEPKAKPAVQEKPSAPAQANDSSKKKEEPTTDTSIGKGCHIVVAEDDAPTRLLLRKVLEKHSYTVTVTEDGQQALDEIKALRAKSAQLDLVFTDVLMPNMDGVKLVTHLNKAYPDLPIVVASAANEKAILKALIKLNVSEFVDKPFRTAELIKKVNDSIQEGRRKTFIDKSQSAPAKKAPATSQDIRVKIEKLDSLINLVGELMIAEAMVTHNPDVIGKGLENFERSAHQLRLITNELQDIAMAIRMVPVGSMFKRMIRLVHDLSRKSGKQIKLDLQGEDTEIDKSVLDLISDPMVHMVRNACDHGVDTLEERVAAGKPETGTIILNAEQKGNEIWIHIQDDGRGMDREKILKRAIDNGIVGANDQLPDHEVYKLVFEPGFSTAEKVTDVSGRGVGMDVVKRNVEAVKGKIDITTELGKGTHFIIRIPLTLATIEGMLVRVGKSQYTIPLSHMRESLRPRAEDITVRPDGQEFVRIRERLYPVIRIHGLHDIEPDNHELDKGIIMVVEIDGVKVCLFVDEILYQMQTVIKPISAYLGQLKSVSGCTILGTGEVALILDVERIVRNLSIKASNAVEQEQPVG